MKKSLQNIRRFVALGALASGLSSCSLLKNGKYANQWEIESDVPASLNSGEPTPPAPSSAIASRVRSNLSGHPSLNPADLNALDLPSDENGSMVEVPKPDLLLASHPADVGQSPVEMLSLPPVSPENDLPAPSAGTYHDNTLLNAVPPAPDEAAAPASAPQSALAATAGSSSSSLVGSAQAGPAPTDPTPEPSVAADPPTFEPERVPAKSPAAPAAPSSPVAPGSPGDAPTKAAPATVIPLLYGKLDLTPYLNPLPTTDEVADNRAGP